MRGNKVAGVGWRGKVFLLSLPVPPNLIIFLASLSHSYNVRVQLGARVFEFFVLTRPPATQASQGGQGFWIAIQYCQPLTSELKLLLTIIEKLKYNKLNSQHEVYKNLKIYYISASQTSLLQVCE